MIGKLLFAGAIGLTFALPLSGCGNESSHAMGGENDNHGHAHTQVDHGQDHDAATHEDGMLHHYIAIQETLAADSMDQVSGHAEKLAENLSDTEAVAAALAIAQTDDIDTARRHFETVSNVLLANLKEHGSSKGTFHEAHCPMAFGNRGASWIQADTTVNNPYYGSMMLRCGEIRETFAADKGPEHAH